VSVAALIVAAGRGTRAAEAGGADASVADAGVVPKQYRELGGLPMLARSIGAFAGHPDVDAVTVVINPDDAELYAAAAAPFSARLRAAVPGGARRQDSVRLGLEALAESDAPSAVLIHDAARPFAGADLIARVIAGLAHDAGALPCLPVTDTLKRGADGRVTGTVDRTELWRAQTPQGFRFDEILAAHRAAAQDPTLHFTDDASVAEWYGLDVALVEGAEDNRKLTTAEDFRVADEMLRGAGRAATTPRVATGYDVHAFGPGDAVMLAGVRIPHTQALTGHSDADVALHALTDALLGTIGAGDIGVHFPPSDARWRGAASEIFLKHAASLIAERGGMIVHVDLSLICEAPRIGPYRDAMRARIAALLGLRDSQVSIKATTNEGLGFIGRGEGIAAMATATVTLP
jgi:2-C-methyl-D-erythritol 4-phosphate cytidylyltransferase/2-C-methyl-D-erythritol 2,4-cyclodiphosphate synthase